MRGNSCPEVARFVHIYIEREKFFEFRFKINGFLPGLPPSFNNAQGHGRIKRGWQIMGRLIVLCMIFLSVFLFPGNTRASIIGEVWSTYLLSSAQEPFKGPPSATPAETFNVESINFDSRRVEKPKNITYNEFLNYPKWPPNSKFKPDQQMFTDNIKGDEGVYFIFRWTIEYLGGSYPITIIHDDGFVFSLVTGQSFRSEDQYYEEPHISTFDLKMFGLDSGTYNVWLSYWAVDDSDTHVLMFNTPEPGTMLLLGLGLIGIGILRRRH